jgi:hypothetical protein
MKRLIGSLAVGLLALASMAGVASATHSNGQGPNFDLLSGSARLLLDTPFGTFPSDQHVNAQAHPRGGTGTIGHFWTNIHAGPPAFPPGTEEDLSGDELCLVAIGNVSLDRGLITDSSGPIPVTGLGVLGIHIDNGEPGKGGKDNPPDEASGALTPPPGPAPVCPPPSPFSTGQPVEQGNFIVHDGT